MSLDAASPVRGLKAGGTVAQPLSTTRPALPRRVWLLSELGVLFIGMPLVMREAIFGFRLPLFVVLAPVFLALLLYLLWDDTFHVRSELWGGFPARELVSIFGIFLVVGVGVAAATAIRFPAEFLSLPLQRPGRWGRIMLLYPVLSVVAQELIYRTFFFHRYGPLFDGQHWLLILVNGIVFGLGHVIYGSYVSVVLTTLAGFLLAWRYERTHSFWAVWLEHSLYGCLVFTVGLGRYFFTGIPAI